MILSCIFLLPHYFLPFLSFFFIFFFFCSIFPFPSFIFHFKLRPTPFSDRCQGRQVTSLTSRLIHPWQCISRLARNRIFQERWNSREKVLIVICNSIGDVTINKRATLLLWRETESFWKKCLISRASFFPHLLAAWRAFLLENYGRGAGYCAAWGVKLPPLLLTMI